MLLRETFVLLVLALAATAEEKEEEKKKKRVFDRELSDKEHFDHNKHNAQYDHEAFLGEAAKTFDQLPPEESKRRLGIIVDRIDQNADGFVTPEELKDWIRFTQKRYIYNDVERQWNQHNIGDREALPWEEFEKLVYGFLKDVDHTKPDSEHFSYGQMLKRDRRRWQAADANGDDALTKEEFTHFLHPEEVKHMKDIIVVETMEDVDKNNDGLVSLSEYIGDMYKGEPGEEEPEWVYNERQQFQLYRDKDGDGYMNLDEVKQWILPDDFDHAEAEARHLIHEADDNLDDKLTKEEILQKYDVFVGSQATDFGEALARHDEF